MRKVYGYGLGGKHRANDDARRWRELTTHIARNIRSTRPRMSAALAMEHAHNEARRVVHELNYAEKIAKAEQLVEVLTTGSTR